MTLPRLRDLHPLARVGIASLVLVVLVGIAASAAHLRDHYQNRDGDPRLTFTDLVGAYHGIKAPSPLIRALESGHPGTLPQDRRDQLLDWLLGKKDPAGRRPPGGNPRLAEDYDSLDLGDKAPAEILRAACLSCHAAASPDPIAKRVPLDYWDNVRAIAFPKDIAPTPRDKLVTSIHAHALALASLSLLLAALLLMTSLPRALASALVAVMGVALLADFACQWFSRDHAPLVWGVMIAGTAYHAAAVLACLVVLVELARPARRAGPTT